MRYGNVTGKLGALAGTFSKSVFKMLELKDSILPNTTMDPFLPLPEGNSSTSPRCICYVEEWRRKTVRKPWIIESTTSTEQPPKVICFNGSYLEWHLKGPIRPDTRALCFYHAELFDKQDVELIKYFIDVEELQLQFGCYLDPQSNPGRIFDHFLNFPRTNVKSLTLDTTVRRLPFPEVFKFICSFPNLEDLRVGDILGHLPPSEGCNRKIISQSPSVRGLTGTFIFEGKSEIFISRLLEQETICHFREIVQRQAPRPGQEGVKELVEACSETLKSIRINDRKSLFGSRRIGPVSDRS